MSLPNFIIFGAIKSGTGALYQYLEHHPQIYMSSEKEPRYFSSSRCVSSVPETGIHHEGLDEYLHFFKGARNEKAIGEASSNYINTAAAASRIKATIPDVKLIASLRNPVDRAYAHFRMVSKVRKNVDINAMVLGKEQGWATTSLYYEQLKRYYNVFDSNQIKILIFENWTCNVSETLKNLYAFLGVDSEFNLSAKIEYTPGEVVWPGLHRRNVLKRLKPYLPTLLLLKLNKFKSKLSPSWPPLPEELRSQMQKWYYQDILKLQSLLNMDLSLWLR